MERCKEDLQQVLDSQGYARVPVPQTSGECSGFAKCSSECVNKTSCEAVVAAVQGGGARTGPNSTPVPGAGEYAECALACTK